MTKPDFAAEHLIANQSALGYFDAFAGHRERLTGLASAAAPADASGVLCILGAGNCFDVDLGQLATRYAEVHLVDVDAQALERARLRQPPHIQQRVVCHAPLDLSGLHDRLERWAQFALTPDEVMNHAAVTSKALRERIGRRFDVVLSACMLSQMQLSLVRGLGDQHRLFRAVRWTLNATHFRSLAELTVSGGKALFVTDVTEARIHPLRGDEVGQAALGALNDATRAGAVFDFADPTSVAESFRDDPVLHASFPRWRVDDAWTWSNGPDTTFLVYACALTRA